jgi:hypothetical protein
MQPGQLSQYSDSTIGCIIQGSNPNRGDIFSLVKTGSRTGNTRSLLIDKASRHEADHSHASNTKVKNEWSHISTPPTSWYAQRYRPLYLNGQTDNNVGKKQTIIFGHINVTNFLTAIQNIKDEF